MWYPRDHKYALWQNVKPVSKSNIPNRPKLSCNILDTVCLVCRELSNFENIPKQTQNCPENYLYIAQNTICILIPPKILDFGTHVLTLGTKNKAFYTLSRKPFLPGLSLKLVTQNIRQIRWTYNKLYLMLTASG